MLQATQKDVATAINKPQEFKSQSQKVEAVSHKSTQVAISPELATSEVAISPELAEINVLKVRDEHIRDQQSKIDHLEQIVAQLQNQAASSE